MCDGCNFSRTRQIDILGKTVMVKNYICSLNGEPYREKPDDIKLQLSITPTEECGCACPFCAAKASMQGRRIDTAKLERVLKELAGNLLGKNSYYSLSVDEKTKLMGLIRAAFTLGSDHDTLIELKKLLSVNRVVVKTAFELCDDERIDLFVEKWYY